MSTVLNCLKQFKILCWKNFLLDKNHYILVPAQLITPVVMILIVFIIRQTISIKTYGNETYYQDFTLSHKDIFYSGSQVFRRWIVAYCPNDTKVEAIMQGIMARTEGFLVVVNGKNIENIFLCFALVLKGNLNCSGSSLQFCFSNSPNDLALHTLTL